MPHQDGWGLHSSAHLWPWCPGHTHNLGSKVEAETGDCAACRFLGSGRDPASKEWTERERTPNAPSGLHAIGGSIHTQSTYTQSDGRSNNINNGWLQFFPNSGQHLQSFRQTTWQCLLPWACLLPAYLSKSWCRKTMTFPKLSFYHSLLQTQPKTEHGFLDTWAFPLFSQAHPLFFHMWATSKWHRFLYLPPLLTN